MLASVYARFRASTAFLVVLVLFVAAWIAAHLLWGFDSDWGLLNLILSIEASISVALIIMANDRQETIEKKQLAYMQHLMEGMLRSLEKQKAIEDVTREMVASLDPAVAPASTPHGGMDGHSL